MRQFTLGAQGHYFLCEISLAHVFKNRFHWVCRAAPWEKYFCTCFDSSCRRSEMLWCVGNIVQRLASFLRNFIHLWKHNSNCTALCMWNHSVWLLKSWNLKLDSQKLWGSRIESRGSSFELPLSGTVVGYNYNKIN